MFNNVPSERLFSLFFFFFSFVHFWILVSGFISQWLAGITISHLESHLDIATRQILSSCYIFVRDAFTLTVNSKFLSYTSHYYPSSTCIRPLLRLLSSEGPTSHQAGWSRGSLCWEDAEPHAADREFPWRRCFPTPFWSKPQRVSCVPHKHSASW